MRAKDIVGRTGEGLAADHLAAAGYDIVERNWRCPQGEIDLVVRDGATLVVVEVKTRSSLNFGHPFEAVSSAKLARLYVLAAAWTRAHPAAAKDWRVDAVSVLLPPSGGPAGSADPVIEHLKGIG
ncbi:YraN family protein [Arthrobacter sp. Helios]|uniref:YraN family protein n=1 Tax=Arthrobacter sp. Helios TaxID=2828862 RepID=UPI0020636570|nr:YraN family protein [Arthrobacter sp. Helios]UPO78610.1 YraN family protein [Arthrobacter sp. Helios]